MPIGGTRTSFTLDPTGLFRGLVAAKKEYDRRALRAITLGSKFFEAELKKELSKPGTGRQYKRRKQAGKGQFHTASAPGQPPAPDLGRLRASITSVIEKAFLSFVAQVGTNVEYAPDLEFGTKNMAARPFMLSTLIRIRPQLIKIFENALRG